MEPRSGDWIVTPRHGKPVEVQALWFNALLSLLADLHKRAGSAAGERETRRRAPKQVKERFLELFWERRSIVPVSTSLRR
jgi:glycogen debranching enzyme